MRVCIPKSEISKCRWSARSHVFIWIATIVVSIYLQSWLPMLFIVLPNFYGKTLISLFGLTQHAGLQENIKDHRYTTRTVKLNPILVSFIGKWNTTLNTICFHKYHLTIYQNYMKC